MSDLKDFYQKIVSIPNILTGFSKSEEVRAALHEIIRLLDTVKTKVANIDESIVQQGKNLYAEELRKRSRHFHYRVTTIYEEHLEKFVVAGGFVPFDQSTEINNLRDFYHYTYYSLFFMSRFILVKGGEFDISEHAATQKALGTFGRKSGAQQLLKVADLIQANFKNFQDKRNLADYIFNQQAITTLAETSKIKSDFETINEIFQKVVAL